MKICIATDFFVFTSAYSLCSVVESQIQVLKWAGHQVSVIVDESFKPPDRYPWFDLKYYRIPSVPRYNDLNECKFEEEDVAKVEHALHNILREESPDFVFVHDWIFQVANIVHNIAMRRVIPNYPNVKWLHWLHSVVRSEHLRQLNEKFPETYGFPINSKLVVLNCYSRERMAANFNIDEDLVICIPNCIDYAVFLDFHPITRDLVWKTDILLSDYIGCYPARLSPGKQFEYAIEIFACLKSFGYDVTYVIIDAFSDGEPKYYKFLREFAESLGLIVGDDVIFLSEFVSDFDSTWFPREVVRDLFSISDVFILPSLSETYSICAHEAAHFSNLLVLNFDFPPLRSIYGEDAIYRKFSSNIDLMTGLDGETITSYSDRHAYMCEIASKIVSKLNHPVLNMRRKMRKYYNPISVYNRYMRPILYD